jgi:hypothetical protein
MERLTDSTDAIARHLLRDAVVYVMPNVCPDGTWRGHLRTNAAGRNLNREWAAPCEEDSPEVYHLLKMMEREGVWAPGQKLGCVQLSKQWSQSSHVMFLPLSCRVQAHIAGYHLVQSEGCSIFGPTLVGLAALPCSVGVMDALYPVGKSDGSPSRMRRGFKSTLYSQFLTHSLFCASCCCAQASTCWLTSMVMRSCPTALLLGQKASLGGTTV